MNSRGLMRTFNKITNTSFALTAVLAFGMVGTAAVNSEIARSNAYSCYDTTIPEEEQMQACVKSKQIETERLTLSSLKL